MDAAADQICTSDIFFLEKNGIREYTIFSSAWGILVHF